ncbi:unnamed protein product [Discula destructiva]
MAQQHYLSSPRPPTEDDIYNVTPDHTGVSHAGRWQDKQHTGDRAPTENPFADVEDEKKPPLPPRRSSSIAADRGLLPAYSSTISTNNHHHHQAVRYRRSKEQVVAYMIPLPPPRGADGQPVSVPERFMLYLPPAPDLLKPPADSDIKERKRDKCARKWQGEVRKAKNYSGAVVSFSGIYCASVRGAVYCLSLIQRSELTFLSRLPRKTLKELMFVHPEGVETQDRRKFELVNEEFHRNKFVAKRDFWIGAVVLPFAQAVDFVIPVGGGFSEVCLVWMIITGNAWRTANGMMKRLVFNDGVGGDMAMRSLTYEQQAGVHGGSNEMMTGADGRSAASRDDDEDEDLEKGNNVHSNGNNKPSASWWKKRSPKQPKPSVETVFRASAALDPLARYVQAACHARNAAAFPDVGAPDTEAGVLTSIGWAPAQRDEALLSDPEERAADTAWQIRQATEDLRVAVAKAAKTWDKFCAAYVKDPERALREEEEAAVKRAKREEKERVQMAKKGGEVSRGKTTSLVS